MRYPLPVRLLLAVAVSIGLAALLLLLLYATQLGFEVWTHLRDSPYWFAAAYVVVLGGMAALGVWIVWRLLVPRTEARRPRPAPPEPPRSSEEITARLEAAEAIGADVKAVRRELEVLNTRRKTGEIHVALFGQISTGKSSLVRALLPDASPTVDPRGGTTRAITHYTWTSRARDRLVLTDLPGLNEPGGTLSALTREEAQRAHVVVYLVDGDLTRDQYIELQDLLALDKPTIVALNKSDLYTPDELEQVRRRVLSRVARGDRLEVVTVSAGAMQEVMRVTPDGREEIVLRELRPRIEPLVEAIQRRIDQDMDALEQLRDASTFVLAGRKLDEAVAARRREQAEALVKEYSRKAVLGAMAAITPGSDLVIQGYLGVQLVQRLCGVYDAPARDINVSQFLEMASRRVGKTLPIFLAIAGNGLKAFPGVGTLTGGLIHAVAYGLIFDSLGRAVSETLATRGSLPAAPALRRFEETLSEDLEARARRLAALALDQAEAGHNSNADG